MALLQKLRLQALAHDNDVMKPTATSTDYMGMMKEPAVKKQVMKKSR
jgi:hypothetical protein